MHRIGFVSAIALMALLPVAAQADDTAVVAAPTALQWKPVPPTAGLGKGTQMAVLFGDPSKPEQYAIRLKLASGTKIAPHTHPNDENVTVLSGTMHFGLGDKVDAGKAQVIKAGGFVHVPKGTPHYAWVTGPTVIQSNTVGPTGRTFMNPADNPAPAQGK